MVWQVLKHQLKQRMQYRESFLISILLHPVMMAVHTLFFKGIYAYNGQHVLLGYSLNQMIWYFGAIYFFYYLVWNGTDKSMSDKVLYSGMETQLVRPFSMMFWEFSQLLSQKMLSVVFEFLPVLGIYFIICTPGFMTVDGFFQYLILTGLSFLQFFFLSYLFGLLSFVWQNISAFQTIKFIIVNVFAGASLPIAFFPMAVQKVILMLPFHYLFHTPVQYLLGKMGNNSWSLFLTDAAIQSGWILLFYLMSQWLYRRTMKHYLSAGG